jgi:rhodanese-related sulfurtransferase
MTSSSCAAGGGTLIGALYTSQAARHGGAARGILDDVMGDRRRGPEATSRARACVVVVALALLALAAAPAARADHGGLGPVLTIDAESLKGLLDAGRLLLPVDVRPPAEFAAGHIPGARSSPLATLRASVGALPTSTPLVLYCACAVNDLAATYHWLRGQGFRQVFVLEEGFAGWQARGYPVAR